MGRSLVVGLVVGLVPAVAGAASLEERVGALERRQAEVYHTLAERKAAGLGTLLGRRISLSGLLELEAAYERIGSRGGESESSSDLAVATAQLGLGVAVVDHVTGTLIFLFEEEDTAPPEVDEATVDLAFGSWEGRLGRQYLPFGAFSSHFVSDPLTLELGETRETAALAGYAGRLWRAAAFLFNGDAEREGDEDHLGDWGASVRVTPLPVVELGASVLSDLADADAELVGGGYRRRVPGWSAFGVIVVEPLEFSGEVLGAARRFHPDDLDADGDGDGDRPLAWNLELAWHPVPVVELAARVEGSRELVGQPELQCGAIVSWGPWEHVSLSLEYLRGAFDEGFGEGVDSRDRVVTQLAVEF